MKPVYLEMNYFGPHEHSIIDFRKLEEAPIFLIGGDTGAGKSTIFDAMTFALFGSTTGDRDAKEMRSQFATPDETTSVIFYFEQGNNLYKITRQPEQLLSKKRGTGLATKKSDATLSVVDEVSGVETQSIASKPLNVGIEIKDILNLNADQFKKIILLPQNDFSEFLKSNTSDKEEILKKIFGTQIFSDFTDKLKDEYNKSKKKNESFSNELQNQIESIAWTDEEREELLHESNEGKVILLKQFVSERKELLTKALTSADTIADSLKKADKKLQDAKNIREKYSRLDNLKNKFQTNITAKKDDIENKKQHVAELDWANNFTETTRDLEKDQKDLEDYSKSKNSLTEQLKIAQSTYDAANKLLEDLNNQSEVFNNKKIQTEKLNQLIPQVKRLEELSDDLNKLAPQVKELEKQLESQKNVAQQLATSIENKQNNLVSIDELQKHKDSLAKEKETSIDILSPIETDRNNLTTTINQLHDELETSKVNLETMQSKLEIAKKDYNQKIVTRRSLMIAQLQQELVDGEACVVCGSTTHPKTVNAIAVDESKLKKSMDEVDESQKNFATAENNLKIARKTVDDINEKITKENAELKKATEKLNKIYTEISSQSTLKFPAEFNLANTKDVFNIEIDNISKNIETANSLANDIKDMENNKKGIDEEISTINVKLVENKSKQQTYQNELDKITSSINNDENPSSEELSDKLNTLNQEIKNYNQKLDDSKTEVHENELKLSEGKTKLDSTSKQVDKLNESIQNSKDILSEALNAKDAKTNDLSILNSWIEEIKNDIPSKIKEVISQYNKEKEILNSDITELSTELKDTKLPDIDELQQTLSDLTNKNKDAIEKSTELNTDFKNAQSSYEKIQSIMKKQGDFAKKLSEITSLYNVINGKDGNDDKLKLETYVVRQYLLKVLNYANDNFINLLSNNRYTFEIAEKGSDKRSDHGLDINVYDNETGATRSSDTLSGGETFIAALSIALSLSEVVQSSANGVQIDALFVDEGFGSLDHETLQKAMTALETIGENRMVGVISHIETMKSTIGQQVLIKKIGDGRSRVDIVNK